MLKAGFLAVTRIYWRPNADINFLFAEAFKVSFYFCSLLTLCWMNTKVYFVRWSIFPILTFTWNRIRPGCLQRSKVIILLWLGVSERLFSVSRWRASWVTGIISPSCRLRIEVGIAGRNGVVVIMHVGWKKSAAHLLRGLTYTSYSSNPNSTRPTYPFLLPPAPREGHNPSV